MMEGVEGVGTEEEKQVGVVGMGLAELLEGFERVVGGGLAGLWGVQQRQCEFGFAGNGELDHSGSVFEAGGGAARFEWLKADGGEEDPVERESLLGGVGDGQVAEVGGVETASEEGYAHGDMVADGNLGFAASAGHPDLLGNWGGSGCVMGRGLVLL